MRVIPHQNPRSHKALLWLSFVFPDGSDGEESACNAGDAGLIPGLGGYPGEGQGNSPQYSYLENPMDRGYWRATELDMTEESDITEATEHAHTYTDKYHKYLYTYTS